VTRIKLKGIDRFRDRHGKLRHYFRAGRGKKRVPLPGAPGSPEFMAAYESLVGGRSLERIEPKSGIARLDRAAPGTFDRLVFEYFNSPDFLRLVATTQRAYRSVIERMVLEERIGHRLVSEMTREHVKRMISKRSASPGAANDLLKKLRLNNKTSNSLLAYLLSMGKAYRDQVADLLTSSAEQRLARILLRLAHLNGKGSAVSEIPVLSHGLLAEMVGTTRPRINLFMNRFRKQGFIAYDGGLEVRRSLRKVLLAS